MTDENVSIYIDPPMKGSKYWYLTIDTPDGAYHKKSEKPYLLLVHAIDWAESRGMSLGIITTHAHFNKQESMNA